MTRSNAAPTLVAAAYLWTFAACDGDINRGGPATPDARDPALDPALEPVIDAERKTAIGRTSITAIAPGNSLAENGGQLTNPEVRFYSRGKLAAGFAPSAVLLKLLERAPGGTPARGVLLRLSFQGDNLVEPEGRAPVRHLTNYFIGNDPARWHTGLRSYAEVVYPRLYDGIDLACRASAGGVKYEFRVNPGADPSRIHGVYEGANGLRLDSAGGLVIDTSLGEVREKPPFAYVEGGEPVACRFVLRGPRAYGIACEGWDSTQALIIDPLVYATFVGGRLLDTKLGGISGLSLALADGGVYLVGSTASDDFPVTPGAFQTTFGGGHEADIAEGDVFVAKLSPSGDALEYATYLGGESRDSGVDIAVDAGGSAYVCGATDSTDFPVTAGTLEQTGGSELGSGFVAELGPDGSALLYSTFLHGASPSSIALDAAGHAYLTGDAFPGFPATPGSFDDTLGGTRDAFVAKVAPDGGELIYGTFLGGSSEFEIASGIVVDPLGAATVCGHTRSADYPVTPGAFGQVHGGQSDAFITQLNASGSDLNFSSYLGGTGHEGCNALSADESGFTVTGETTSTDFPVTAGAFDTRLDRDARDAFITKFDPTGAGLVYSTFLGDDSHLQDYPWGLALDADGRAHMAFWTNSTDLPVTAGAFDPIYNGNSDGYVAILSPTGNALDYGSYLGGSDGDMAFDIAVDEAGMVYVAGGTASEDFPVTAGAFDTTHNGMDDAFVVKLNPSPPPVCDAGGPYTVECAGGTGVIPLDATGSSDVGGGPLQYSWTTTDCPSAAFDDPTSVAATLTVPGPLPCVLDCAVTLVVTSPKDVTATCSSTVTVQDATPPSVVAPPPLSLECSSPGGVPGDDPAILDWLALATASDACTPPALTHDAPSFFPSGCPPAGATETVTFVAADGCHVSTAEQTVTVADTQPPGIDVQPVLGDAGCAFLWPPEHGYSDFAIGDTGIAVHDACSGFETWFATCASSQAEDDAGDGASERDCVLSPDGQRISARAERAGACASVDRAYTMTVQVVDACGNEGASEPFSLCAYHDPGHRPPGPIVYSATPGSNATDWRPGTEGTYGVGCGTGCSHTCDP